jgi:uncharacterized membrane protein
MTTRWLCCALAALGVMPITARQASAQPLPCRYKVAAVIEAPTCGLGGVSTIGTAINPSGTTIVGYRFCLGTAMPWKWTEQTGLVMLTLPPWLVEATPADVNDNNIMVGTGVGPVAGSRGFLCDLETGIWTELMPQNPPIGWSGANAISNSNVVVGFRSMNDGGDPVNPQTAFIWHQTTGQFTDLGTLNGLNTSARDVNALGLACGHRGVVNPIGFVWDGSSLTEFTPIPGGVSSNANGLNDASEAVGAGRIPESPGGPLVARAFLWRDKAFEILPPLAGYAHSAAVDLSSVGVVIGTATSEPNSVQRAWVYLAGQTIDLNSFVSTKSNLTLRRAFAIDETGNILCEAASINGTVAVILSPMWPIAGDTNCDQQVNVDDFIDVILSWGPCNGCPPDLTGDDQVDVQDLLEVILHWG